MEQRQVIAGKVDQHSDADRNDSDGIDLGTPLDNVAVQPIISEDPLLKFFLANWAQMLGVIAVAVLGYFAVSIYRSSLIEKKQSAADLYAEIREEYESLATTRASLVTATDEAKKTEIQKSITETTKRLEERLKGLADTIAPYTLIATTYQGLLALDSGQVEAAERIFNSQSWKSAEKRSIERFVGEIAALRLARSYLDSDATLGKGRMLLLELGSEAEVAAVPAALSLASISTTTEEKAEAKKVVQAVLDRNPTENERLSEALARLE